MNFSACLLMGALLMLARDRDVGLETEDFPVRDAVDYELARIQGQAEEKGMEGTAQHRVSWSAFANELH